MFVINEKLKGNKIVRGNKYIKHMWGRKNGNSKHFLLPLSVLNTTTDLSFLTSLRPPCWSNLKTNTTFELIISFSTKPLKLFCDWSNFLRRPPCRKSFSWPFYLFRLLLETKVVLWIEREKYSITDIVRLELFKMQ
jgi:hypothetical protein